MSAAAHAWLSRGEISVLGTGMALPGEPVATGALIERFAERFGLERERQAQTIAARMEIGTRHFCRPFNRASEDASPGQSNPDLAAAAVAAALGEAGLETGDLGYLIGHTSTPAQPLPANIAFVADRLGYAGPHLELRQACTGFANALAIAFGLLANPYARPIAIVGSETGSMFYDPARAEEDSGQLVNMIQMGDGAAAIILGPASGTGSTIGQAWSGAIGLGKTPGIEMRRDGRREFHHDFDSIRLTGSDLFDAGAAAAVRHGVALDSFDTIIPHQVSGRIGMQCATHFGLPPERFFVNADRVGNTGSAAIWLALHHFRDGGPAPGARALVLGAEASKYMHGGFVYTHG